MPKKDPGKYIEKKIQVQQRFPSGKVSNFQRRYQVLPSEKLPFSEREEEVSFTELVEAREKAFFYDEGTLRNRIASEDKLAVESFVFLKEVQSSTGIRLVNLDTVGFNRDDRVKSKEMTLDILVRYGSFENFLFMAKNGKDRVAEAILNRIKDMMPKYSRQMLDIIIGKGSFMKRDKFIPNAIEMSEILHGYAKNLNLDEEQLSKMYEVYGISNRKFDDAKAKIENELKEFKEISNKDISKIRDNKRFEVDNFVRNVVSKFKNIDDIENFLDRFVFRRSNHDLVNTPESRFEVLRSLFLLLLEKYSTQCFNIILRLSDYYSKNKGKIDNTLKSKIKDKLKELNTKFEKASRIYDNINTIEYSYDAYRKYLDLMIRNKDSFIKFILR